jgi:hypothetical protein
VREEEEVVEKENEGEYEMRRMMRSRKKRKKV